MGVFDLAQNAVNASAGVITGELTLGNDAMMEAIEVQLQDMGIGELIGLFLETQIVKLCMGIMAIIIFIVVFGRMIEIYLVVSVAPIPLSTMANREWGQMGNNYLKSSTVVCGWCTASISQTRAPKTCLYWRICTTCSANRPNLKRRTSQPHSKSTLQAH